MRSAGVERVAKLAGLFAGRLALIVAAALPFVAAAQDLLAQDLPAQAAAQTSASQADVPQADTKPAEPAPAGQSRPGDQLATVLKLDSVAIGFALSPRGRTFVPLSRLDGSDGPQVIEWVDGKPVPFPDAAWNAHTNDQGADPANRFVGVTALRIGPRGSLWVVDSGAPGLTGPKLPRGPKVVRIDLATNRIARTYALDEVTKPKSRLDDIRFHGGLAYITDAGAPGVVILDLASGAARRVLDDDPSLTAQRPISADDHVLRGPDGAAVNIHADQLEVSPDGKFFYYQPASGPMSRVATRYLDNPKLSSPQLAKNITTFAKTGSTGGTAIDDAGNIYCSNTDRHSITVISPEGRQRLLVQDPRLLWVDAMWIDAEGWLYMPAAQLDRMAPFNGGQSKLQLPITIYRMKIDAKPPASDHP